MSVSDGQKATAQNFNDAFASKQDDNTLNGTQDLTNTDTASGGSITNVQRELNSQASFTGKGTNISKDAKPVWNDNSIGTSSDSLKDRADLLTTEVDSNNTDISNLQANKVDKVSPSTDNALPRFDGTGGDLQDSGVTVDDSDNLTVPGNATIQGDLTVNGTTTTVNTDVLDVEDQNITVNNGGTQATADDQAGLTVEMSDGDDAQLLYDKDLASKWKIGDVVQGTSEIITAGDTQTMSAKTLSAPIINDANADFGTASDTKKLVLPQDTTANLTALTREEGRLYYSNDEDVLLIDDGSNLNEVSGSGGTGSGGKNFFDNPTLDSTTDGVSTFNDGVSYVDGTGGVVAGLSIATNTTTPLAGDGDLQISKAAVDSSGDGVTFLTRTIDRAERGRKLVVRFEWDGTAVNYPSGDFVIKAFGLGTGTELAFTPIAGVNDDGTLPDRQTEIVGFVITESDTTDVRLSLFLPTDNATASTYDVFIDEMFIGVDAVVPGAILEPIKDINVTFNTTNSNFSLGDGTINAKAARIGEYLKVNVAVAFGSTTTFGTGEFVLTLDDFTPDGSRLPENAGIDGFAVGSAHVHDSGSTRYSGIVRLGGVQFRIITRADNIIGPANPFTFASGDDLSYEFIVPVIEFSKASASLSTTEVAFTPVKVKAQRSTTQQLLASGTDTIIFDDELKDEFGAYDNTTGIFTVPKDGDYWVAASLVLGTTTAWAENEELDLFVGKNGTGDLHFMGGHVGLDSSGAATSKRAAGMILMEDLKKGDTLRIVSANGSGSALNTVATAQRTILSISEAPDFSSFSVFGETEIIEAFSNVDTANGGTDVWTDLVSVDLTPGVWSLTGLIYTVNNGTITASNWQGAISENSGGTTTDHTLGLNEFHTSAPTTTTGFAQPPVVIADYIVTITESKTFFLKFKKSTDGTNFEANMYRLTATRIK